MPYLPHSTIPRGIGACITPKPKALSNVYPRNGVSSFGGNTGTGTGTGTGNPPVVSIQTFVLSPGITVTWTNTGGPVVMPYAFAVTLYGDPFSPPTTILDSTTTTSLTYTSSVGTNYDYYYYYTVTGTNADGSSSDSTSILQAPSLQPTLVLTSFYFSGIQGSLASEPTWNWFNTGGAAVTQTYTLYSDTFSPPTTVIDSGFLGPTSTDYHYFGATVDGNYYALSVVATNTGGSGSFYDEEQNNRAAPVLTYLASYFDGTHGSTSALPTWVWNLSGGELATQSYTLYGDASNPPTTVLASGFLSTTAFTYAYSGATVLDYYYKLVVTGTNTGGTSSFNDAIQNLPYPPIISFTSFSWLGTLGSISASPQWTWSFSGGAVVSLSFVLYDDNFDPPTSVIAAGSLSSSDTTYNYTGTTVANDYYRLVVTATNSGGSDYFTNTQRNLAAPSIALASFSWTGGQGLTTSAPQWTWTSTGGAVASYNVRLLERVMSTPPYVLIANQTLSGSALSYLYSGATQQDYEYQVRVTAFNATGNSNFIDTEQNLLLSPNPVFTSFAWDGTDGSGYSTLPHWYWTNTGGGNLISQNWMLYGGSTNPPTTYLDSGTLLATDTDYQWGGTTVPMDYYQFVLQQTNTASAGGGGPNGVVYSAVVQSLVV